LGLTQIGCPLSRAENHFLELLITEFTLTKGQQGSELTLSFDGNTQAITQREEKDLVRKKIEWFTEKAHEYQEKLDALLLGRDTSEMMFSDPAFPFRYASGGTLPILRIDNEEYYCLFYRDIFPVGWNIANGGTDSLEELLNPLETIQRELREELIVFDLHNKFRYVFKDDYGKPLDRPEFYVARQFWRARFSHLDFPRFTEMPLAVEWINGPDALKLSYGNEVIPRLSGFFLNINAEDFGIEVDKIAIIDLDDDVTLCDGEIYSGHLVNRPVGLFKVQDFNDKMLAGEKELLPDRFFYNAKCYRGGHLKRVVEEEALPEIAPFRTREQKEQWFKAPYKYGLCPVTRKILHRYLSVKAPQGLPDGPKETEPFIFISYASEDEALAKELCEFLRKLKIPVFFSRRSVEPGTVWEGQMHRALDSAHVLIALASNPQYLRKEYVEYECNSFFKEIITKKKPEGRILPFICCFHPANLPRPLSSFQSIVFQPEAMEKALAELADSLKLEGSPMRT
jgi:hypothetical protein